MINWQPIETAPKDGKKILVIIKGIHSYSGMPFQPAVAYWGGDRWIDVADYDPWDEDGKFALTHWAEINYP